MSRFHEWISFARATCHMSVKKYINHSPNFFEGKCQGELSKSLEDSRVRRGLWFSRENGGCIASIDITHTEAAVLSDQSSTNFQTRYVMSLPLKPNYGFDDNAVILLSCKVHFQEYETPNAGVHVRC
jgi:hypothetical protein